MHTNKKTKVKMSIVKHLIKQKPLRLLSLMLFLPIVKKQKFMSPEYWEIVIEWTMKGFLATTIKLIFMEKERLVGWNSIQKRSQWSFFSFSIKSVTPVQKWKDSIDMKTERNVVDKNEEFYICIQVKMEKRRGLLFAK